jgi:hypothetical protein
VAYHVNGVSDVVAEDLLVNNRQGMVRILLDQCCHSLPNTSITVQYKPWDPTD